MQQACSIFSRCVAPQSSTTTQCSIRFTKQSHSVWPTMCLPWKSTSGSSCRYNELHERLYIVLQKVWRITQHLRIFKWIVMEHNVKVKAVLILGLFFQYFSSKSFTEWGPVLFECKIFYIVLSCSMNIKTALYLFVSFFFLNHKNESIILLNIHNPSIEPSNCDKHFGHNCTVQAW